MPNDNFLRHLNADGQHLPKIKLHSLEKIRRHNYYADLFTAGMHRKWPQLAYLGLFAGAGRAVVEGTGEIVETSAMSVIRLRHPFTKYIFVDRDRACISALQSRIAASGLARDVTFIDKDVNEACPDIVAAVPRFGRRNGLLSFCFVDPFSTEFKFDVLRQLSPYRMDFLVLLMLGWDARVNLRLYLNDEASTRIGDLVDAPRWRDEYRSSSDRNIVRFLMRKFDDAMARIGYLRAEEGLTYPVKAHGTGVLQYVLAFYTKNPTGKRFWRESLKGVAEQQALDF